MGGSGYRNSLDFGKPFVGYYRYSIQSLAWIFYYSEPEFSDIYSFEGVRFDTTASAIVWAATSGRFRLLKLD